MSDDDFMMEDDDNFEFEYEEDSNEELEVGLENRYYAAKGKKVSEPTEAISEFKDIVKEEQELGTWGFKSTKQLIKISFRSKELDSTLQYYEKLLEYIETAVTRNYSEKSINNLLDLVSSSTDISFLERFYSLTLTALDLSKNERLSTKTNLKLAKVYLDRNQFNPLSKLLKKLRDSCKDEFGEDDQKKGTLLLEILALEIQMHTLTRNNKTLKELYSQCLAVKSAIPHPKIMGIIRECGGKMHMSESKLILLNYQDNWEEAQTDFFESFKSYDEAGSSQRIQCLKYLVLANMLAESLINPFDSPETKPYQNDPEITAMTQLVASYQNKDIKEFEKILRVNGSTILGDPFIKRYIDNVLKNIRIQVILNLVKPYTRIHISFIASKLSISLIEVEELIVELVMNDKLDARIDQINQQIELIQYSSHDARLETLKELDENIQELYKGCLMLAV